jgi:hypothetical protein
MLGLHVVMPIVLSRVMLFLCVPTDAFHAVMRRADYEVFEGMVSWSGAGNGIAGMSKVEQDTVRCWRCRARVTGLVNRDLVRVIRQGTSSAPMSFGWLVGLTS